MKENSKAKEMDIFGLMGLINASFNNIRGLVEFKYWSFSTNFLSIEKPKDAKSISKTHFRDQHLNFKITNFDIVMLNRHLKVLGITILQT